MQIHSNRIADVLKFFQLELGTEYTPDELQQLTYWVLEKQVGLKRADLMAFRDLRVNQSDLIRLEQMCYKLKKQMPVQYVLGEAEFYGLKFKVNKHVLIPRPETEELVEKVLKHCAGIKADLYVLDMGTGSGCIPVSIKKNLPGSKVYAIDISKEALQIACYNANQNKTEVVFKAVDILHDHLEEEMEKLLPDQKWDVIISNPPYVLESEKATLDERVKNFEPHLALFVEDQDPILFYRKIAFFALKRLKKDGFLFFECHSVYAKHVYECLLNTGFESILIEKDMAGMERFVIAKR